MWKILVVLLLLGVGAAALWVNAGRAEGPAIEIAGPGIIGQTGEIAVKVTAPGGDLTSLNVTLVQGDNDDADLRLDAGDRGDTAQRRRRSQPHAAGRQAGVAGSQGRRGASERDRRTAGAVRPAAGGRDGDTDARGAAGATASRRAVAVPLHQSRRLGDGRVPREPARCRSRACASATTSIAGFPAGGADPALRVAFFALLWDQDLRTRRSRCSRATRSATKAAAASTSACFPSSSARARSVSTIASSRAWSRRFCRTHQSSQVDDPGNFLASYLAINRDLRRMQQRNDLDARARDGAGDPVAGRVQAADQHGRRGGLRRSAHLRLQRQRRRSSGASRLRSRVDGARPFAPRTAAASCMRAGSGSTATASSSITAWACNRCTRTCRRSA